MNPNNRSIDGFGQSKMPGTRTAPSGTPPKQGMKINHGQGFARQERPASGQFSVQSEVLPDFERAANEISRESFHKQKKKKKRIRPVKLIKRTLTLLAIITIGAGGFFAYRFASLAGNVFSGGGSSAVLFGDVAPAALSKEGDGRVNSLVIGIGGEGHDGANLADTIMIASLDPFTKEASLVSIPRDFYVEYNGSFVRINEVHALGEQRQEGGGPEALETLVEEQFDIPIHYYMRLEFSALEQAVDVLGGIDVEVANEVYDASVANTFGKPLAFKPGVHTMDGRTALIYSRSRKGTIGGGDFARTERQKEVMQAMFVKGLAKGTFSSPSKVSSLLSTFNNNVKTSISLNEIMQLYNVGKEVDVNTIKADTLGYEDDDGNRLLSDYTTSTGAQVLIPSDGIGDNYRTSLFIRSKMVDSYIKREQPNLVILNASGTSGLAGDYQDLYEALGYTVSKIDNFDGANLVQTELVEINEKEYSKHFISKRLGVVDLSERSAIKDAYVGADYVIILGTDAVRE